MNIPVVSLVGRPNVGKSALFNRIVGGGAAIVSEEAGTTRDRHYAQADWNGRAFWLVDTGGITDDPRAPMDLEIRRQVRQAIEEADLLLLVVDAKAGLHPVDSRVVEMLRDKQAGTVVKLRKEEPAPHRVINLMDALRASIGADTKKKPAAASTRRRAAAPAKRTAGR